ncbi:MAG: alpha/beta hydrolase [Bacteroidota bacterium]
MLLASIKPSDMQQYNPNHPIRMRHKRRIPFLLILFFNIGLQLLSAQKLPEEWFLSTGDWENGPRLFVKTIGTGPEKVILLHGGWGGEHRSLIRATEGLRKSYTFILYDQRGSLRSPFPDSLITLPHHIEDLELLRKELRLEKLTLVGHSMGTFLASAYHQHYPDRVKKLILLAPVRLKNPVVEVDQPLFEESNAQFQGFLKRPEVEMELGKYRLTRPDSLLNSMEKTAKFRINMASRFLYDVTKWVRLTGGRPFYNPKVYQLTESTNSMESWDFPQNFLASGIPITAIIGDHDFLDMGAHITSKFLADIPNVELVVLEKAGHELWLDQPKAFRKAFKKGLVK